MALKLRDIVRDEKGTASVEAILMFPLLVWAFVAMFVFFEGLRESNINLKATYTVGDLLSRETDIIDQDYLDGMNGVYGWLSRSAMPVSLRISVVRFEDSTDKHILVWSRGVDQPQLTQEEVEDRVSNHIPIMADADTVIVVETWTTYDPIMDIGLSDTDIYNIVITSPRFSKQLLFEGVGDGTGTGHQDGLEDLDNVTDPDTT